MWTQAKIVSLLVIFWLSFLSGTTSCVAVLCLKRKYGLSGHFQRIISLLNCFSGGVFFATSILHLLPEAREKMEETLDLWGYKTEYPLTEVLTGVGFLLILTFENISHMFCSVSSAQKTFKTVKRYTSRNNQHKTNAKIVYTKVPSEDCDSSDGEEIHIHDTGNSNNDNDTYQEYSDILGNAVEKTKLNSATDIESTAYKPDAKQTSEILSENDVLFKPNGASASENKPGARDADHSQSEIDMSANHPRRSKARAVILLAALSFHMVFDGLALGLLDEDNKVWTLLLALCIHKILVFLSIGLETVGLLKSFYKAIFLLLCFAAVSPLGIVIGVTVTSSQDKLSQSAASAILQSVASGTFIYVTFFEILHREYEGHHQDMLKVLCTVVGFVLVGAVKLLESFDA